MLSDRTLERVSDSYRRGYHDGYDGKPKAAPGNGIAAINHDTVGATIRPFTDFDYEQGYSAGANDAKWARKRAATDAVAPPSE